MNPLTVLALAALPFPSRQGTQVLVGEICEGLSRRGHRVHLLCYAHGALGPAPSFTVHRVADFPRYRSLRSGPSAAKVVLDLRLAGHARALARALRPDVVHAHGHEAMLAAVTPTRMREPLVYHAHTRMGHELPWYFKRKAPALVARLAGRVADMLVEHTADAVAAVSQDLASELGAIYVPPAVRLPDAVQTQPRQRDVIYVGNLDGYQGLDVLLGAIARTPEARLTVVSESSPYETVASACRAGIAERVRFVPHGTLENARELLSTSSIVVVPRATSVGFPIKLLEALGAAAPVVVSKRVCSGLTNLVHARVVADDEMATSIADLLANSEAATAMGERGRRHVLDAHDPEEAAKALEEVYRRAIARRSS